MSSTDKKWQDKFDDGDLDNLDWLEVGPQVLENIEDRIYPPKKKNNILFFLIGAGLLLSIGGLFTLLNESTTQDHLSAEVTTKTERSRSVATTEINTPEREREPYVEQMTEYTTDITTESENSITTTDATNDRAEKNAVTDKNIVADITSPIILEDNSLILHESKKNVTKFNSPPPPTSQKQAGNAHDFQKINSKITNPVTTTSINQRQQLSSIPLVESIRQQQLNSLSINSEEYLPVAEKLSITKVNVPHHSRRWYAQVGFGSLAMQLNQNFQSALNPALFYSKKGENNSVQLGRFFAINSRLKLNLGVGYERVAFISGHESQVDYFISSETGSAENTIDLTMATPLGFIEGDAVIDRSDNITDDQTALRLDLTNEHKYQSADINFGLSYAVVSNNSFEISLQPSIALKRLFNISNELILVETNHQDFSTLSTQVTNNQESINKTLPELGLGLNLSKILSNSSSLGIFYQYRTGLKPIHSFQDFSTGFSSHNAGLRYEF